MLDRLWPDRHNGPLITFYYHGAPPLASFLHSNVQDDGFTAGTTLSNWWPQWGGPAQRKLATPTQNHSPDVSFINGIRPIGSSFREDWSSPHCA